MGLWQWGQFITLDPSEAAESNSGNGSRHKDSRKYNMVLHAAKCFCSEGMGMPELWQLVRNDKDRHLGKGIRGHRGGSS
jgi:hypothetical protein